MSTGEPSSSLRYVPPVLIGMAVDVVALREESFLGNMGWTDPRDQFLILVALTVIIWVLESLFEYFYAVLWRNLAQTAQHELRMSAYSHIQDLEMRWFSEQTTGGLMAIMNDDVNQLERFLDQGATDLLQVATTVVVVGGIMFAIAPEVAILAVIPVPIIVIGSFAFQRRIGDRYTLVREEVADLNALLNNNLSGITTIKSFTAEDREVERVRMASETYREANKSAIRLSASFVPLIRMAILFAFTANMLVGGWMALDGALSIGAYSVIVFITQRLLWPLTRLGQTFDLYQRAMASTTRVLDLRDTEIGIVEGDVEIENVSGEIEYREVTFAYPGRSPIYDDLNLSVQPGQRQRIAIARAVLKDAPILVLDEATSNVDNETEAALQRSVEILSKDRTTIIIAHRLSTIRNADRIAVLDGGVISEIGSHEQLVQAKGLYSRLWDVQTGQA